MPSIMTKAQLEAYHRDGFVIVPGMFDREEVDLLLAAMEKDPAVRDHMIDRADAQGAATRISLWNRAGDSVYGMAARCGSLSQLSSWAASRSATSPSGATVT